jgi:hypothetical protein
LGLIIADPRSRERDLAERTIQGTREASHMKKGTRKPFVVPQLKEQASLAGVTLVSGGGITFRRRGGCFGDSRKSFGNFSRHGRWS